MFHGSIKPPDVSYNSLSQAINFNDIKTEVKLYGNCLTQDRLTFTHKKVVNIYNVYQIILWPYILDTDFALGNSLFGAIKFIKNADPDKCKYSGYGIGIDECRHLLSNGSGVGKNVIFGADIS